MRSLIPLVLLIAPPAAIGADDSVEIAGVPIRNGMSIDEVRSLIPHYAIHPIDKSAGVPGNLEFWFVSSGKWTGGGEIDFKDGRVTRATGNLQNTEDPETYEMFVLLHELLVRLTGGQDTCLMIRTGVPQRIFPQSDTALVLPDRVVRIGTASRFDGQQNVSIQESTRVNPVPASERVRKGMGEAAQCVFVGPVAQEPASGANDG